MLTHTTAWNPLKGGEQILCLGFVFHDNGLTGLLDRPASETLTMLNLKVLTILVELKLSIRSLALPRSVAA